MSSSRHVVIGGLGNLGRHLQRALLESGRSVTVLDRPNHDSATLLQHKSVDYIPYSLGFDDGASSHQQLLTDALKGAETVYSVVTPDVQNGTVREFEQTNHIGMHHLIQSCRQAGVPKLVYASSLAVTNHFIPSHNQTEATPLPDLDSYETMYDRTKRLGEDLVLQANTASNYQTCALRLGGILAGPTDYYMRQAFQDGEASGRIYAAHTEPIDTIAASDVAVAMMQADNKLSSSSSPLAGRALFVTKSRNAVAPRADDIATHLADLMGWQVQVLPPVVLKAIAAGAWLRYKIATMTTSNPEDLPGMPPHKYLDISNYEQTFDNSLAHELLDFAPQLSWEDAVEKIVKDYKSSRKL